jgi:DNA repair protein RadC
MRSASHSTSPPPRTDLSAASCQRPLRFQAAPQEASGRSSMSPNSQLALAAAPAEPRLTPPAALLDVFAATDVELLGVLLGNGRVRERSMRLARELLGAWGGLPALPGASSPMLTQCGLRPSQAGALLATCEIACRMAHLRIPRQQPLSRPEEVATFLRLRYQQRDQEVMGALFLDARHAYLGDQEIFRGTLHRVAVEPREILKQCLLRGAAAFLLFHTHPSGDPTPSPEDLLFTRRMADAGQIVGVDLVDHLILGSSGRWLSLNSRSVW